MENWKYLREIPKIIKKIAKYRDSCLEIEQILNRLELWSSNKYIIMNISLCKPVIINNKKIIIYNTCAFDSILTSVVVSYIEHS